MNIKNLVDAAKQRSGLPLGTMADEMNISPVRISEWKRGKYRPGPSQIIYLAEKAQLPAIQVLAEIETQTSPQFAECWKKAVNDLLNSHRESRFANET
jgi:transcriptional regulator with XRE-family HTH domain